MQVKHLACCLQSTQPDTLLARVGCGNAARASNTLFGCASCLPLFTAGRFVCNYTLYESLRQCQHQQQEQLRRRPSERGRWQAVFVHVPSFSVVPAERQLAFATDLLQLLALQPATEPQQDEAGAGSHGSLQQLLCWVQQQKVPAMFACLTTWFTLKTK